MKKAFFAILLSACVLAAIFSASFLAAPAVFPASVEKARMLTDHGLNADAKKELIAVVFGDAADENKAEAYYLLGSMAFDENNMSVALDSWDRLVKKHPDSPQAILVKGQIQKLAEIVGESAKETVDNAVARSYLRNGDFWSRGKSTAFAIDSEGIREVEAAVKWYDNVIAEFPGSPASRIAYEEKMRTLLVWIRPIRVEKAFDRYMLELEATFSDFEKKHPAAATLQAFRYQIAQAHWKQGKWGVTRKWLNYIIAKAGDGDSFYKDLAQRRLLRVEY